MNIVYEIKQLQKKVDKLYCSSSHTGGTISIPTIYDNIVYITEHTRYGSIGDTQNIFNRNISAKVEELNNNFNTLEIEIDLT